MLTMTDIALLTLLAILIVVLFLGFLDSGPGLLGLWMGGESLLGVEALQPAPVLCALLARPAGSAGTAG